jgi:hypothetical protein
VLLKLPHVLGACRRLGLGALDARHLLALTPPLLGALQDAAPKRSGQELLLLFLLFLLQRGVALGEADAPAAAAAAAASACSTAASSCKAEAATAAAAANAAACSAAGS